MTQKRFKIGSPEWLVLSKDEQEALLQEAEEFKSKVMSGKIHPCTSDCKLPTLILYSGKASEADAKEYYKQKEAS